MNTLKPVGKNFLVTPFIQSKKKKGGILLPDSAIGIQINIWNVVAVGKGCELVKVGSLVILHSQSGVEPVTHEDMKFGLANEVQIIAIVEEK